MRVFGAGRGGKRPFAEIPQTYIQKETTRTAVGSARCLISSRHDRLVPVMKTAIVEHVAGGSHSFGALGLGGFCVLFCGGLPSHQIQLFATAVRLNDDITRLERLAQHINAEVRLRVSAHEDVQCGVVGFRPRVDRNVTFRQHRNAGDAAVWREMVEVAMQKRRPSHVHATLQRRLDVFEIVDVFRAEQIDDQMVAGVADTIALDEEVEPFCFVVFLVGVRPLLKVSHWMRGARQALVVFLMGGA